MFLPSFITPSIISRIGTHFTMLLGFVLLMFAEYLLLLPPSLPLFFVSLALIGLAWNLAFVAATALLTTTYEPSEKDLVSSGRTSSHLLGLVEWLRAGCVKCVYLVFVGSTYFLTLLRLCSCIDDAGARHQ